MKLNWTALLVTLIVTAILELGGFRQAFLYWSILSSAIIFGIQVDFESLAERYIDSGHPAGSSTSVVGASGVRHHFAFTASSKDGTLQVVADTALSVSDVEETKVLGFFAKVYDVKPKAAVLCVSPRLNSAATELARQYGIVVLSNEKPRELVPMLGSFVDKALGIS